MFVSTTCKSLAAMAAIGLALVGWSLCSADDKKGGRSDGAEVIRIDAPVERSKAGDLNRAEGPSIAQLVAGPPADASGDAAAGTAASDRANSNYVLLGYSGLSRSLGAEAAKSKIERTYLKQKAQAHRMLREACLMRARAAANPADQLRAKAEALMHQAKAEKMEALSGQTKRSPSAYWDNILFPKSPQSAPCCRMNNLAYGRSVTASSQEEIINNFAQLAVDGDLGTRWCAESFNRNEWIQVDLGSPKHLKALRIHWEMTDTKYSYRVDVSVDGRTWKTAVDASNNEKVSHMTEDELDAVDARFLRITFLGSDTGAWASIREIEVVDGKLAPPPVKAWEQIMAEADAVDFDFWLAPGVAY